MGRTKSINYRIESDITRWRNLAGQLEESAAWISSREPKTGDLDKINLDSKVLFRAFDRIKRYIKLLSNNNFVGTEQYGE